MIALSRSQQVALDYALDGHSLNISGKAGTGKSVVIKAIESALVEKKRSVVLLAPTGCAAAAIGGQTVDRYLMRARSFQKRCGFVPNEPDTIIVDECSMLSSPKAAELAKLFGNSQFILVGDSGQLPPVIVEFDALGRPNWEFNAVKTGFRGISHWHGARRMIAGMKLVELSETHRQSDLVFIGILSRIRDGSLTQYDLGLLNTRVRPRPDGVPYLAPLRQQCAIQNNRLLAALNTHEQLFVAIQFGDLKALPFESEIRLKLGARVMARRNHVALAYVNGSVGTVIGLRPAAPGYEPLAKVQFDNGSIFDFTPIEWICHDGLEESRRASFQQIPLQLAYCVSIHKSQGMSLDRAHVDLAGVFECGQTYVALSRLRSLEGLTLETPITRRHVLVDPKAEYRPDESTTTAVASPITCAL